MALQIQACVSGTILLAFSASFGKKYLDQKKFDITYQLLNFHIESARIIVVKIHIK